MTAKPIAIACDHAGFPLKQALVAELEAMGEGTELAEDLATMREDLANALEALEAGRLDEVRALLEIDE